MPEQEQCECCLGYTSEKCWVVCQSCVDKARQLEQVARDRRFLFTAVEKSLVNIDRVINEDLEPNMLIQLLAEVGARLYVAHEDCKT